MLLDLRTCLCACQDPLLKRILEAHLHSLLLALPKLGSFPHSLSVPREFTLILMLGWKTKPNQNFVFKKEIDFFFKYLCFFLKRTGWGVWNFNSPGSGIRFPGWYGNSESSATLRLRSVGEGLGFPLVDWRLRLSDDEPMFPSRLEADSQLAETWAIALSGLVFWIWMAAFLYACSSSYIIMCYLNNIMLRNTAEVKKLQIDI